MTRTASSSSGPHRCAMRSATPSGVAVEPSHSLGKHYLLVADTGDNAGKRKDIVLHVFEEPARLDGGELKPAWTIRARWPDGPRDCEAVAVDAAAGQVLLVSKKRNPPDLFALPLARSRGVREARRIGRLAGVPLASAVQRCCWQGAITAA